MTEDETWEEFKKALVRDLLDPDRRRRFWADEFCQMCFDEPQEDDRHDERWEE